MSGAYQEIVLTDAERFQARRIGLLRNQSIRERGGRDQHGMPSHKGDFYSILGCGGEIACARALGISGFEPTINTFHGADIGDDIQVRTMGRHYYDLLVRPRDNDEHRFILVTWGRAGASFRVHGYIRGADAKRTEWEGFHGGREMAYFVPQQHLLPLSDLIQSAPPPPSPGFDSERFWDQVARYEAGRKKMGLA